MPRHQPKLTIAPRADAPALVQPDDLGPLLTAEEVAAHPELFRGHVTPAWVKAHLVGPYRCKLGQRTILYPFRRVQHSGALTPDAPAPQGDDTGQAGASAPVSGACPTECPTADSAWGRAVESAAREQLLAAGVPFEVVRAPMWWRAP